MGSLTAESTINQSDHHRLLYPCYAHLPQVYSSCYGAATAANHSPGSDRKAINGSLSNNSLQLPRIPNSILNDLSRSSQDLPLTPNTLPRLSREIYLPVASSPALILRKLYDCTFRFEEEECFGAADGDKGV